MAQIKPFRPILYQTAAVGDLSRVLTPPYDVISPEQQEEFYARHERNFVRLDLGRGHETDTPADNRYTRAARDFRAWVQEGVFRQQPDPGIYVYDQTYTIDGREFTRRAFVSRVKLERYGEGSIYPHELTHPGPKQDRLELIKASHALFSQIFALYDDEQCRVNEILESGMEDTPVLEFEEPHGGHSRVGKVSAADSIRAIQELMADKALYIADGHHRYETSLNFRDHAEKLQLPGAEEIVMACVSMSDPGLVILPTHRAVELPAGMELSAFLANADQRFTRAPADSLDALLAATGASQGPVAIGMFLPGTGLQLLTMKPDVPPTSLEGSYSGDWHSLPVSTLHGQLFKECMGMPEQNLFDKGPIYYSHLAEDCLAKVTRGEYDLAFFVRNAELSELKSIVRNAEKMPPKSTFFYPKLMSGVFIDDLSNP